MIKTLEVELEVGNWIKPNRECYVDDSTPNYIKITEGNVDHFNGAFSKDCVKIPYFLVEGEEIKEAENYFAALKDVKIGDYINVGSSQMSFGEFDKIAKIPKVENSLEVQSYRSKIKTEKGFSLWYVKVPDRIVPKEDVREHFDCMMESHLRKYDFFKEQLEDLGSK
jgi:hypothetical protein